MVFNQRNDIQLLDEILDLQQQVEDTIVELMKLRDGVLFKKDHINNRTDDELNKVCQLISLCFMTLGKWHEGKKRVLSHSLCYYISVSPSFKWLMNFFLCNYYRSGYFLSNYCH